MKPGSASAWLAAVLPVLAVNLAFLMNINAGLEACFPYWDGCMSVSRGIRSGPGLMLFKVLAWPSAVAMMICWRQVGNWIRRLDDSASGQAALVQYMGMAGAGFFIVYAMWLGTDGEVYRWLRRYGVVFYFGLTALAQLFFASLLWKRRHSWNEYKMRWRLQIYFGMIFLGWVLGVASALKRKLIEDLSLQDRMENLLEWDFALVLSLTFLAIGLITGLRKPAL